MGTMSFSIVNTLNYSRFELYIDIFCEFYFEFHKNDYFNE